jgi:hypothetical protein
MYGHQEMSAGERRELRLGEPRRISGKGKGDALVSSRGQEDLQNNEIRCYLKEKVSKAKEAHTVPPPMVQTNHVPSMPLPTRSETRSDPCRGREMAAPSAQPRSFEGLCLPGLEELELRHNDAVDDRCLKTNAEDEKKLTKLSVEPRDQGKRPDSPRKIQKGPDKGGVQLEKHPTGATSYERLKTNVSNEVEGNVPPNSPEAVCTQPRIPKRETRWLPDERLRSRVAEGPEPHHNDAVNKRHSNLNVEPKRKLTNSSVEPRERDKDTDLPGKARKGPDKELGRVEMHLTGATNYERSETNVNDRMKQVVSSNSPMTRAGAVYAQLQVPKQDYESRKGSVVHTTARREIQDYVKHRPGDGKDAGVETRQCLTCDLSHTSHDATRGHVKKGGESFGVGVSANARDSTSAKYSTSTTINRCNGERGRHN